MEAKVNLRSAGKQRRGTSATVRHVYVYGTNKRPHCTLVKRQGFDYDATGAHPRVPAHNLEHKPLAFVPERSARRLATARSKSYHFHSSKDADDLRFGVTYSINKQKRWELVDALKADEEDQLAELADLAAGNASADALDSPTLWRVAVVDGKWARAWRGGARLRNILDPDGDLVDRGQLNEPLPTPEAVEWTKNRKGEARKALRAPGKNVVKATHQNSHRARVYQVAAADEIYHVLREAAGDSVNHIDHPCDCAMCHRRDRRTSRPNRWAEELRLATAV